MRKLLNPFSMLVCGLVIGPAARLMDIYCDNLGEIFSQMSVWILLGTLIAIYSPTKKAAALNILPFCLGMLLTYYAVAIISHGIYGRSFIIGWTMFALWQAHLRRHSPGLGRFEFPHVRRPGHIQHLNKHRPCLFPVLQKDKAKHMKKAPFRVLFSSLFCILMSSLSAGWCSALAFSYQGFLSIV